MDVGVNVTFYGPKELQRSMPDPSLLRARLHFLYTTSLLFFYLKNKVIASCHGKLMMKNIK